jgi:predicted nucleotide-binding protein
LANQLYTGNAAREIVASLQRCKASSLALLRQAVSFLEGELDLAPPATPHSPATRPKPSRKVFVVHGRDDATKNEVALFLSSIGLEPIILHTRPHGGRNILTKFQEESQGAGFAVILMTPDDEGALVGETLQKRARQNVVFELGFFIGKLGTSNVAALVKGHIEKPSDFDGIGYIDFDAKGEWKRLLAREMQYTQIPFDASKVFTA